MLPRRPLFVLPSSLLGAWFLAIYAPALGHGFIRDDFAWIGASTVSSLADVWRLFRPAGGFYRPVVGLSFAVDRALFDLAPLPYALTNLALLILCAAAIVAFARALDLPTEAGVMGAGLWLLNPHGINTTLLWMSGRTALLLTLFAVLAAVATKRGRPWLVALLTLLAMLSKEEAIALPFVFAAWAAVDAGDWRTTLRRSWPAFLSLLAYFLLRAGSAAMMPWTAPTAYRFTFSSLPIARNVVEYANRSCTFFVVAVVLVALVTRSGWRRLPVSTSVLRELAVWLAGLFALTLLLPLRSGLYVLAPSVAVAILAGAWLAQILAATDARGRRRTWALLAGLAVASVPIYWTRNAPDVRRGELASSVLREVAPMARTLPAGSVVLLRDHFDGPATLEDAFGALATEAVALASGRDDLMVWLDPVPFDLRAAGVEPPDDGRVRAVFELRKGTLTRSR